MILSTSTNLASNNSPTVKRNLVLPHINLKLDSAKNNKIESKDIKLSEETKKKISDNIDKKFKTTSIFTVLDENKEVKKFRFLKPVTAKNTT